MRAWPQCHSMQSGHLPRLHLESSPKRNASQRVSPSIRANKVPSVHFSFVSALKSLASVGPFILGVPCRASESRCWTSGLSSSAWRAENCLHARHAVALPQSQGTGEPERRWACLTAPDCIAPQALAQHPQSCKHSGCHGEVSAARSMTFCKHYAAPAQFSGNEESTDKSTNASGAHKFGDFCDWIRG